ncbi:MAG: winged helix-turn-helix domain-containing tetratricopeptide repeat protein [Rhodoferax sp.]
MSEGAGAAPKLHWCFGKAEVRADERLLLIDGQPVSLGSRAFDLLVCLIDHRERMVGKDELLALVWPDVVVEESNLTVHVAALRKLLGHQAIATIPGRGYRFTAVLGADSGVVSTAAVPLTVDKPSLAVLPFDNLTGDASQDYFVDGVVDDITSALSRVRAFFVIARSSSFTYKGRVVDVPQVGRELGVRYVVEGSVRMAGAQLRIGVQLLETTSGRHVWSQRFEGKREDIFALQDQITSQVVAAVEPRLILAEIERARTKPTDSLHAYELCLQALPLYVVSANREDITRAIALLGQAIAMDPGYSYAKAAYAWCHVMAWANGWIGWRRAIDSVTFAQEAALDHRDDPTTLARAGHSLALLGRRHEEALRALDLALVLNPNSMTALNSSGWVHAYVGDTETAFAHLNRAMHLNPLDPEIGYALAGLAFVHLVAGRYEEALRSARRALLEFPIFVPSKLALMHALARTGQWDEARATLEQLRVQKPGLTITAYRETTPFIVPAYRACCIANLEALGCPP